MLTKSGPVAQNVSQQASLTQDEFRNLANSTTNEKTATGQPLTRKRINSKRLYFGTNLNRLPLHVLHPPDCTYSITHQLAGLRFLKSAQWQNPRATGIVFSSAVVFIFMTRYLNIMHYFLRFSYFVLGSKQTS